MPTPDDFFSRQDDLIRRRQALMVMTEEQLRGLLGRDWPVILPGIYARSTRPLTENQRLRAGLLYAGDDAQIADVTALQSHRLPYLPAESVRRFVVPDEVQRKSKDFVVIHRTKRMPEAVRIGGLPVEPVHRAVCEFVARHDDWREAFAVAAAAVQLGRTTVDLLAEETECGPARGRARLRRMVECLRSGVRSGPENDFRDLVLARRGLPEPLWNCVIELPNRMRLSPDGLLVESALVTEINSREYHDPERAGANAFEITQWRADLLTTAGLTVLGFTPKKIWTAGRECTQQVLDIHRRDLGKGLPPGVKLIRLGPPGTQRRDAAGADWPVAS